MKTVTTWFILLAPFAILLVDYLVFWAFGTEATITGVVRAWSEESAWPEVIFLAGVVLLYAHLYRGWL